MYSSLKRQCAHLSPIMSGDGASSVRSSPSSNSSSASTTPTSNFLAPPPPSAVEEEDDTDFVLDSNRSSPVVDWKVPRLPSRPSTELEMNSWKTWRKSKMIQRGRDDVGGTKFRKIENHHHDDQYAKIKKGDGGKPKTSRVRFRDEFDESKSIASSMTSLNSDLYTSRETESSFWSDQQQQHQASFGFSKYLNPSLLQPRPPPPSPSTRGAAGAPSFPRTNPYATLPRQLSTNHYSSRSSNENLNHWPLSSGESSGSSTTTGTTMTPCTSRTTSSSGGEANGTWTRYDRRYNSASNIIDPRKSILSSSLETSQRRRILAGLKSFGIKGELLISILLNRGMITITIEEARNIVSPCVSGCCSTYVRLSLMPDEEKRTQCKTELIPYTNRPVFHQTFTVELLPEDYEKRLVISMWHRETAREKSILLGCMAFTIRHMMESNKLIDGWYFLLSPEYGRKKHLAVHKVNMLTYYGSIDQSGIENNRKCGNTSIHL